MKTSSPSTPVVPISLFNSNALRFHSPLTGTRHRRASESSTMRSELCTLLQNTFPEIRRIKVQDSGIQFSARVWLRSGRIVCRKAYSLQNLYDILQEGIEFVLMKSLQ